MDRYDMLKNQYDKFYLPAYRLIEHLIHPDSHVDYIIMQEDVFDRDWERTFDAMKALVEDSKDYVSKLTYDKFYRKYNDLETKKREFRDFCKKVASHYLQQRRVYDEEDIKREYGIKLLWAVREACKRKPRDVSRSQWIARGVWLIGGAVEAYFGWLMLLVFLMEAAICGYVIWKAHELEVLAHASSHQ